MSTEVSAERAVELEARAGEAFDEGAVAEELQRVYEYVLSDRRPEAVGATECLAEQLGIDIERPDGFPMRADR
ncbi:MAG: hypothetical protein V5A40_19745 [Haloarculaceae archaeon]